MYSRMTCHAEPTHYSRECTRNILTLTYLPMGGGVAGPCTPNILTLTYLQKGLRGRRPMSYDYFSHFTV